MPSSTVAATLQARASRNAQPLGALLELTYSCNWRCVFCYNPRHHDERPLDAATWAEVLDDLRALGTLNVTLTGGEPLTHPEAFAIMEAVRARAMFFRLFTNGSLVTDEVARRLQGLYPVGVELSLHGAQAATHDRTTGKPGSFAAMWRGIEALRRHGVPVVLKTPLTRINEDELDEMIALTEREGLPYALDVTLTHRDDGDPGPLQWSVTPAGLDRFYSLLARLGRLPGSHRTEGGLNCGLGRTTLAVDPEGNVYPCPQWRKSSLGNVRRTRLARCGGPLPCGSRPRRWRATPTTRSWPRADRWRGSRSAPPSPWSEPAIRCRPMLSTSPRPMPSNVHGSPRPDPVVHSRRGPVLRRAPGRAPHGREGLVARPFRAHPRGPWASFSFSRRGGRRCAATGPRGEGGTRSCLLGSRPLSPPARPLPGRDRSPRGRGPL